MTRDYDPDRDTGYDPRAAGTAMDAPGGTGADADRDFVTSSYDPDRDTGYDPRAAGTAMDPADGPVARNTNRDDGLRRRPGHGVRGRPARRCDA